MAIRRGSKTRLAVLPFSILISIQVIEAVCKLSSWCTLAKGEIYLHLLLPGAWGCNLPKAALDSRLNILIQVKLVVLLSPTVIYQCWDKLNKMYKHTKIFLALSENEINPFWWSKRFLSANWAEQQFVGYKGSIRKLIPELLSVLLPASHSSFSRRGLCWVSSWNCGGDFAPCILQCRWAWWC